MADTHDTSGRCCVLLCRTAACCRGKTLVTPRPLPQVRGKGYRGDSEGVESVFGLEAGSDTAAWANRPHNYARMQARLPAFRLSLDPAVTLTAVVEVILTG